MDIALDKRVRHVEETVERIENKLSSTTHYVNGYDKNGDRFSISWKAITALGIGVGFLIGMVQIFVKWQINEEVENKLNPLVIQSSNTSIAVSDIKKDLLSIKVDTRRISEDVAVLKSERNHEN